MSVARRHTVHFPLSLGSIRAAYLHSTFNRAGSTHHPSQPEDGTVAADNGAALFSEFRNTSGFREQLQLKAAAGWEEVCNMEGGGGGGGGQPQNNNRGAEESLNLVCVQSVSQTS